MIVYSINTTRRFKGKRKHALKEKSQKQYFPSSAAIFSSKNINKLYLIAYQKSSFFINRYETLLGRKHSLNHPLRE